MVRMQAIAREREREKERQIDAGRGDDSKAGVRVRARQSGEGDNQKQSHVLGKILIAPSRGSIQMNQILKVTELARLPHVARSGN